MTAQENLVAWLNDAYAMEQSLIPVLENHAEDARRTPAVATRIDDHARETREQAERVEECLRLLNEKPSTAKSIVGKLFGAIHAPGSGMYDDELVKNCIMDFATEAFEMACYEALIVAAEELGQTRIAELCRLNLQEEQQMAEWLRDQLPQTVHDYLSQVSATATT